MRITKVYTRRGDQGDTDLVGGQRESKGSMRIESYGTVDELNSHIGLLAALLREKGGDAATEEELERIQSCLFNVGTYLATDTDCTPLYPSAMLPEGEVKRLETQIDTMQHNLPPLPGFVLPGSGVLSAQAHVCRTVCRRAERCVVRMSEQTDIADEFLSYLNRLSDYLFVLSRKLTFVEGKEEKIWHNICK
ncbi:MAG: cob(I)yrinic acid a,c-diamide adenosyltransferase [Prevotella sp.]